MCDFGQKLGNILRASDKLCCYDVGQTAFAPSNAGHGGTQCRGAGSDRTSSRKTERRGGEGQGCPQVRYLTYLQSVLPIEACQDVLQLALKGVDHLGC